MSWRLWTVALLLALGGGTRVPAVTAAGVGEPGVEVVGGPRTATIDRIVEIITTDLGLPMARGTRVHVYVTREAFRRGLIDDARLDEAGADELATFAVGMARPGRVLLNGRLAGGGSEWLRLVAHELTHVAQFELAGGEGRAEQWLAEGMAEHVAFQTLQRLGTASSVAMHRRLALVRVQRHPALARGRLDLVTLGSPREFTLRHQREGSVETYHLSFLLADHLVEAHGFEKMVDYFARLRRQPSRAAFAAAFGQSLEEFEADVLAYLTGLTEARGD